MSLDQSVFLVVDDIEAMRKVITHQLRTLGIGKVVSANNGAEALAVLRRQHVDVILSDWNMPVMSGLELLKALRADPELQRIPFVMITAEAERARVQEAIANGVSNLLVKPYTTRSLADRIERARQWESQRSPGRPMATESAMPEPRVASPAPSAGQLPTILVVDDTPDYLRLLTDLFKNDYKVRVCDNGQRALEICCSDTPPDLVLLDVVMPGMDGFEVARRMREHPSAETIPVIFITSLNSVDAQMQGAALGAVDYVSKPIEPDLLKPRVRNFMRYVALHKELQAEFDAMQQLTRLREDVEHITRHDVKAPLAGIMALVQPLMEEGLRDDQVERLRLVEELALQALEVVNLTTEIYKIETGRFQLRPQAVPIGDILMRVINITRASYSVKAVQWHYALEDLSKGAPQIAGDPVFCYSILQNLMKNACEATPQGGLVRVTLELQDGVVIRIENAGAVPDSVRATFFDKYSTAGKPNGTGMGTYSAKLLTAAQGGTISMETSDADDRTSITLWFPLIAPIGNGATI
ncbi:response regulator [Curvibacter sp. APW13]|uniref:ATP-binding response regulator n=1 Tax=Curvibacter sp. APW13 TaxID=3077236 RepID=UPI0028DD84EE|nr:response regulator [Curvibacter sp. APW13]MDT8991357.1 response regulator [Curvibacter sp. APW13]